MVAPAIHSIGAFFMDAASPLLSGFKFELEIPDAVIEQINIERVKKVARKEREMLMAY